MLSGMNLEQKNKMKQYMLLETSKFYSNVIIRKIIRLNESSFLNVNEHFWGEGQKKLKTL